MLEEIEEVARQRGTGHPYRFMNYCMEWQRPFAGCGEENLRLMLMGRVSGRYDSDGFFQTGRAGRFKLDIAPGAK